MSRSKTIHSVSSVAKAGPSSAGYEGAAWVINTPIGDDISPDADGVFGTTKYILVDLSKLLSIKLGRQMPMTATYRLKGLQIGLRNVDDADDNDRSAFMGGTIFYHSPTKHKIDALQAARYVERINETDQVDGDSAFFGGAYQAAYKGFRFNWSDDDQVDYATGEAIGNIAGQTRGQWNIQDTLVGYSYGLGVRQAPMAGALWGRRTGGEDEFQWAASIHNAAHEDSTLGSVQVIESAKRDDYDMPLASNNHCEVVGGLLLISFSQCNSLPNGDASPDDYQIQISAQIEGWSQW